MKCLYCDGNLQLKYQSSTLDLPFTQSDCVTCQVIYTISDETLQLIDFHSVEINGKLYRLYIDLEDNTTTLQVNEDIGGLNWFPTICTIREIIKVSPQNLKDKIKTLLTFL